MISYEQALLLLETLWRLGGGFKMYNINSSLPSTMEVLVALMTRFTMWHEVVEAIPETNHAGYGDQHKIVSLPLNFEDKKAILVDVFSGESCGKSYNTISYSFLTKDGYETRQSWLCHTGGIFKDTDPLKAAKNDNFATDIAGMFLGYLREKGIIAQLNLKELRA
jgi:hypothetical protein